MDQSKTGKQIASTVRIDSRDHVGSIELGAADATFVLNRDATAEIVNALWTFDTNPDIRVVTIRGANPAVFCGGGDLRELAAARSEPTAPIRPGAYGVVSAAEALYSSRKPVVAQVSGMAVGAGFELVLASDIVICSPTAVLSAPESRRGTGGLVLAQLLGRFVPRRIAFDLLYSGRAVTADEALELNLVNEVVAPEDLPGAVDRWLTMIASMAPLTLAAHRATMNYLLDFPVSLATRMPILTDPYSSADLIRGIDAFNDKSTASWEGT